MTDAETVLRKLIDEILETRNYSCSEISIKALTSGGANYTSTLFSANVTSPTKDDLKLFAKVANVNENIRTVMKVGTLFSNEDFFYTDLAKVYTNLQVKYNIPEEERLVFPKFFGSNLKEREETVVLEDLTENGYEMYSRFKPVDWEYMSVSTQALARFHALSFAYKKEDPDNFEKCVKKLKVEPENNDDPNLREVWGKILGGAIQVAQDEYKDRLTKFLCRESIREEFHKFKEPLSTSVLCHGDYRISNLMFQKQGELLKPIMLDYQLVHPGSPVVDLLYLEFMGTDEQFRRDHHQQLVDYYYEELTLALRNFNLDASDVYSRETFDSEFKQMLPIALLMSAIILPLVTVEVERAPTLGGEASMEDIAISPNQLFAERFSGIVNDCVRWGVL